MGWIKQKVGEVSTEIVGYFVVVAILAIGAAIWAVALSWAGPLVIVLVLGILGLGLWISTQLYNIRQKRRKGFTTMSNDKIEATVRSWLDKQGYAIRNASDTKMLFQFVATDIERRNITICRPVAEDNFIFIGGGWNIPPEIEKWFDEMPEASREEMLEQLRIELLRMKVDHTGLNHPIRHVAVQVRVPCDETCTEAVFLQHWVAAKFAYIMMTEVMRGALRREGHDMSKIPNQR